MSKTTEVTDYLATLADTPPRFKTTQNNSELHFSSVDNWLTFAAKHYENRTLTEKLHGYVNRNSHNATLHSMSYEGKKQDEFFDYGDGLQHIETTKNRECPEKIRDAIHAKTADVKAHSAETATLKGNTIYNDECGLTLDTTAYFMGEEAAMLNYDTQEISKPIIWIACNVGGLSDVQPHQFENRGIALIRVIHALEQQGISVGLIGYSKARVEDGLAYANVTQTIVVKNPQDALDETTLINIFARQGLFRTVIFGLRYKLTNSDDAGRTQPISRLELDLSYATGGEIVILPYSQNSMSVYHDADTATDWTISQIQEKTALNIQH